MGIIYELRRPGQPGAYNARTVLAVMVAGLEEELQQRLEASPSDDSNEAAVRFRTMDNGPSIDSDGSFETYLLQ
jgi:hypothetical protein